MGARKVATTVYLTPEQDVRLKRLHDQTGQPVAVLIREGVDLVLRSYADRPRTARRMEAPVRDP
jgi:predicted DNA-binding protein